MICLAVPGTSASHASDELGGPYIDAHWSTAVPFGAHSHWIAPWRSYLETVPAARFVDAAGMVFNVDSAHSDDTARLLAAHGIHRARVEINWGDFDFADERRLIDPARATVLRSLRRFGLRPLILLNANSNAPCPMRYLRVTVSKPAARGQRELALTTTAGLTAGYSGLQTVSGVAGVGRILIAGIRDDVVLLSQPLPADIAAGTSLGVVTFKYRPFAAPGSTDFARTLAGWQRYTVAVAQVARRALGTAGQVDGGFDLEVWNELTFGSEFLSIDNYIDQIERDAGQPPVGAPAWSVGRTLMAATAAAAVARPDLFSGVALGDGFANTIPWPASATEPGRVTAIDKHPYPPRLTFPRDDKPGGIDAALQRQRCAPSYTANFPEYYGTALATETIVRDLGPYDTDIYGTVHGRFARSAAGRHGPVPVWITEFNVPPNEADPAIGAAAAMVVKAKAAARALAFFVNKGATQLDFYAAAGSDTGFGMVPERFFARRGPYPVDDRPYLSLPLVVIDRMVQTMNLGLDRGLARTRTVTLTHLAAAGATRVIFAGDGSAGCPDLRAVDAFAFLPFEVNPHRLVIAYYVMTRDVMRPWPAQQFDITIAGIRAGARVSVRDPFSGETFAVSAKRSAGGGVSLRLTATDYPKLLIVND